MNTTPTMEDCANDQPPSCEYSDLPCQFNWNSLVLNNGEVANFIEDKGCQPYQDPCASYSFIKVMEAHLNFQSDFECEHLDFSIPWFDFATWTVDGAIQKINSGTAFPEDGCGNFPFYANTTNCATTVRNLVYNQAITPDLCFSVNISPQEPEQNQNCQTLTNITTASIQGSRLSAANASYVQPSTIEKLKCLIIEEGPLVAVIHGSSTLTQYRDYNNASDISYHSFVLTGWENVNDGELRLNVDDHWPGNGNNFCGPGQTNVLSETAILNHIANGNLELISISSVSTSPACSGVSS